MNDADDVLPADGITPDEAAALVRVTGSAVRQWIKTGKLRAWKRGLRFKLVSRAEVLALAAGRVELAVKAKAPPRARTQRQREAGQKRAREALRKAGVKC